MSHLVVDFPAIAFERLGPLESPMTQYWLIGGSLFLLLTAVIAWPIAAWRKRGRREGPRSARLALWLAAVLLVAFVVALAVVVSNPLELIFGVPEPLRVVVALPIAAAVLTAVSLGFTVAAWRRRYWRLFARVYYTIVALSALALLMVLWYWNLLGYHLR